MYLAEDIILRQKVILKLIKINEDPDISSLAHYLWHYEISLNQRASSHSKGNSLLKLTYAQRDEKKGVYVLVTEYGGLSLRSLLIGEEESEDSISFSNFRVSSNKKMFWDAIFRLIEGLYALHSSGLLHRNLSLDTIYFDGEAYRQGEKEIFKMGGFNWSIYLYSLSNIFNNELSSELIKDNYHFFRAPECLPSEHLGFETAGETFQSDLFSLGLVISFLLLEIKDIEKYTNSELKDRPKLYENISNMLENFSGYSLEKEILSKLIYLDMEERFQNIDDLINRLRELMNEIKYHFIKEGKLPINFNLERKSPLLRHISNRLNINIDAFLEEPNEFLSMDLKNSILYLTNDLDFPLYTRGPTGTYYKFGKAFRRNNLSQIRSFLPNQERSLELTSIQIAIVNEFYWVDKEEPCPYSRWEEIFANAVSQIKESQTEVDPEAEKKKKWLKSIKIIGNAEEEIEKRNILSYQLIHDSLSDDNKNRKDEKREVIIHVFDDEGKQSFANILSESENGLFELIDTDNIFEPFKRKRLWKFVKEGEQTRNYTEITLEGEMRNDEVFDHGLIRLWDFQYTISLLRRKRRTVLDLESNQLLLDAILRPAITHTYYEKYDKNNLVSFIYYTNPIFLLQGPPGTGKTFTATKLIKYTLEKDPFSRILIASKEHEALDDLLEKCQKLLSDLSLKPVPKLVRLISPDRELFYPPNSISSQHFITNVTKKVLKDLYDWKPMSEIHKQLSMDIKHLIQNELDSPSREWINIVKESSNLIFCTTTAFVLKELELTTQLFDLVIIEEAGKTYPSELFKPMQLGNKWVLIGDQNQLPPFKIEDVNKIIDNLIEKIEENDREKDTSDPKEIVKLRKVVKENVKIFNSIFNIFKEVKPSFNEGDGRKSCDTLIDQWRLPSKVSKMISSIFYEHDFIPQIEDPVDFITEPLNFKNRQLNWINIPLNREYREQRKEFKLYNSGEIRTIKAILSKLKIGIDHYPFKLAILSPYKEQVERLKNQLPTYLPNMKGINLKECCFTVDGFQGKEADLIIISLVRNNFYPKARNAWGFVPQSERLNVMFSRAKKAEIVVGSLDLCLAYKNDPLMEKFIKIAEFFQENGKVINLNEVFS